MRVVVAPDSFKGSISAEAAAGALAEGWWFVRPGDEVLEVPMADGGDGTAVVVELAAAGGLPLMTMLDPLDASTFGLGEMLQAAAEHPRVRRIVVALGGSATTDGGAGALRALGARFLDADRVDLPLGGGSLSKSSIVEPVVMAPEGVVCLADVTVPLLGPPGAAAQFAPQEGATPADVGVLECGPARPAEVLGGDPARPGTGAAGGTAYGPVAAWEATIVPGAEHIAAMAGLPGALVGTGLAGVDVTVVAGSVAARLPEGVTGAVDLTAMAGGQASARSGVRPLFFETGRRLAPCLPGMR